MKTEGEIRLRERDAERVRDQETKRDRTGEDRTRGWIWWPGLDFRRGRDGPMVLVEWGCRRRRQEGQILMEPRTISGETLLGFLVVVDQNQFPEIRQQIVPLMIFRWKSVKNFGRRSTPTLMTSPGKETRPKNPDEILIKLF
jgi:hypothetical protein